MSASTSGRHPVRGAGGGGRTPGMRLGRSSARRTRRAGCHPRPGAPRQAPRCSCRHPDRYLRALPARPARPHARQRGGDGCGGTPHRSRHPRRRLRKPLHAPPRAHGLSPGLPAAPRGPAGPRGHPAPTLYSIRIREIRPREERSIFFLVGRFPFFFAFSGSSRFSQKRGENRVERDPPVFSRGGLTWNKSWLVAQHLGN